MPGTEEGENVRAGDYVRQDRASQRVELGVHSAQPLAEQKRADHIANRT